MITQDEAVNAVNLMIDSLSQQAQKFPQDHYLLVSVEIANHLSSYVSLYSYKPKQMFSGDSFQWKGFKCKVA